MGIEEEEEEADKDKQGWTRCCSRRHSNCWSNQRNSNTKSVAEIYVKGRIKENLHNKLKMWEILQHIVNKSNISMKIHRYTIGVCICVCMFFIYIWKGNISRKMAIYLLIAANEKPQLYITGILAWIWIGNSHTHHTHIPTHTPHTHTHTDTLECGIHMYEANLKHMSKLNNVTHDCCPAPTPFPISLPPSCTSSPFTCPFVLRPGIGIGFYLNLVRAAVTCLLHSPCKHNRRQFRQFASTGPHAVTRRERERKGDSLYEK